MIKNSLVIIPCNVSWDWSTDYINQTAHILGKTNTVICVFWIDARSIKEHIVEKKRYPIFFRSIENGVIGYHAVHLLPFRRFQVIYHLNLFINIQIVQLYAFFLSLHRQFEKRSLWFFDPICYPVIKLFPTFWFRVYDCIDYFRGDPILSKQKRKKLIKHEDKLIQNADLMTVNSTVLHTIHSSIRKDIRVVPQGFRLDEFKQNYTATIHLPEDKPIIGYVGAINYRLNFILLNKIIRNNKQWLFVFIGPIVEDIKKDETRKKYYSLQIYENVRIYPNIDKQNIPSVIKQFDIGMIPYDITQDFNKYCYPMKLFEYFYMGKPVISTPIEELKRFPKFVKIGRTAKEWEKHIQTLLSKSWPKEYQKEEKKLAIANSWKKKIDKIMKIIE